MTVIDLMQVWKAATLGMPAYLRDRLTEEGNGVLETEEPRLLLIASAFRARSIGKWNNLPMELRTKMRLQHFNRNPKTLAEEQKDRYGT